MGQQVGGSVRSMGGQQDFSGFAPTTTPMQNLASILGPVAGSIGGAVGGKAGGLMGVIGPLVMLALMGRKNQGVQNPMIKY